MAIDDLRKLLEDNLTIHISHKRDAFGRNIYVEISFDGK